MRPEYFVRLVIPSKLRSLAPRGPRDTAIAKLHQLFVSSRRDYHERRVELLENVAVVIRHNRANLRMSCATPARSIVVLSSSVMVSAGARSPSILRAGLGPIKAWLPKFPPRRTDTPDRCRVHGGAMLQIMRDTQYLRGCGRRFRREIA
jgi:hypothetical protein